jgi:hypothetical protein
MDAFAALMYGIKNLDRTSPYAPDTKEHDFMYIPPSQLNPPSANVVPRKSFLKDQTTLKVFK